MGVDLLAINPSQELPIGAEWDHPTMSWRLWQAFTDLLDELGVDQVGISHTNDGSITDEQARAWSDAIRSIAPEARRYVQRGSCWFEIGNVPTDKSNTRFLARPDITLEDPATTQRWLLFVADYLKHSGGCLQR